MVFGGDDDSPSSAAFSIHLFFLWISVAFIRMDFRT